MLNQYLSDSRLEKANFVKMKIYELENEAKSQSE